MGERGLVTLLPTASLVLILRGRAERALPRPAGSQAPFVVGGVYVNAQMFM